MCQKNLEIKVGNQRLPIAETELMEVVDESDNEHQSRTVVLLNNQVSKVTLKSPIQNGLINQGVHGNEGFSINGLIDD